MEIIKILVVDDEEEICELTRSFLRKRKYCTFGATSADEAMQLVEKEKPHLVLLDIRLGEASGIDVLKKIKGFDRAIKAIMVTALNDQENIDHARSLGADGYIIKPFVTDYLDKELIKQIAQLGLQGKDNR
ncbi:MAG: response regulator [Candidatus Omnitrophica bacterium]|nr:response regulator [Candidatus Omnitrophota bacterium]